MRRILCLSSLAMLGFAILLAVPKFASADDTSGTTSTTATKHHCHHKHHHKKPTTAPSA